MWHYVLIFINFCCKVKTFFNKRVDKLVYNKLLELGIWKFFRFSLSCETFVNFQAISPKRSFYESPVSTLQLFLCLWWYNIYWLQLGFYPVAVVNKRTQIEKKQLYSWGEIIHVKIKKNTQHTKQKSKHTNQENKT